MTKGDYIKANRRGSREAELEDENGWTSRKSIHKTPKSYRRKPKYKPNYFDDDLHV